MHLSFLPYLCDPATQEELSIEIQQSDGDFVLEGAEICIQSLLDRPRHPAICRLRHSQQLHRILRLSVAEVVSRPVRERKPGTADGRTH